MLTAEDQNGYYRIPADNRDLNYEKYFEKGSKEVELITDYNSHNTHRLDVKEMISLLYKLPYINKVANGEKADPDE